MAAGRAQQQMSGVWAGALAMLFILIAIIIYAAMLPEEERAELLELPYSKVLLVDTPGKLYGPGENLSSLTYYFPSILRLDNRPVENLILERDYVYIYRSLFSNNFIEYVLEYDANKSSGLKVYLYVKEHSGPLNVYFNDEIIFRGEIEHNATISVPKDLLRKTNRLRIECQPVGFKFWEKNFYSLSLKAYSLDFGGPNSTISLSFTIKPKVFKGIYAGRLVGYFKPINVGGVEIYVNQKKIFSGIPPQTFDLEFDDIYLQKGHNQLLIKADKNAAYKLLYLKLYVRRARTPPVYWERTFNIDSNTYTKIKSGKYICQLELNYTGITPSVTINGHSYLYYPRSVCEWLQPGENKIMLKSKSAEVSSIKLEVKR